jgi:hypothetical protein
MEEDAKTVNRRRLLRRAGTVAAGLGAAGVASAVAADPASAAAGDPVVAGQTVSAGSATTAITNDAAANPTLKLGNPSGPQLQLVPTGTFLAGNAPIGSLNSTTFGDLEYQAQGPTAGVPSLVYTSYNATQTWPVIPFRALDTRGLGGVSGNGRELILNPGVLNAAGKLPANQTLQLNLTDYVKFGWAVIGNVTMQGPETSGFITIWPAGVSRPNASTVNFLAGWPVSNGVTVALGAVDATRTDVVQIYTANTTHLIFDVMGFIVPSLGNINPVVLPFAAGPAANHPSAAGAAGVADRAAQARAFRPTW